MSIFEKLISKNTLYYPGCLSKFVARDLVEDYRQILRAVGVDFIELSDLEVCCGSPVLKAGFEEGYRKLAEKNLAVFRDHGVGKIITSCPACALNFEREYPKVLGKRWDIEVEHITQTIRNSHLFRNSKFEIRNSGQRPVVTYHDPCHLGRLLGVYDAPRGIIKKLGYELVEMDFSRENSFCCGGGGGVRVSNQELSEKICGERLRQAKETEAMILVTTCPMCFLHLRGGIERLGIKDLEVKELSELILERLDE